MSKTVLFTYDYELFLGSKSGTVESCLLKPTEKILKAHNFFSVKAVFFVDTLFLWRLKSESSNVKRAAEEYDLIVSQLQRAVKAGHYIFPHIHAHWLDAVYQPETGEWDLSNIRYYRFTSLPVLEQNRVFDLSIHIIKEITAPVTEEYMIDSYRAGGWSIQPFSRFRDQFIRHNIKYEFSVIPGKKVVSEAHVYDFTEAPQKNYYFFEDEVTKENPSGRFTEFTISTVYTSHYIRWIYFKLSGLKQRLGLNNSYGDGSVISVNVTEEADVLNNHQYCWVASMEGLNFVTFVLFGWQFISRSYFQFISHPKLVNVTGVMWLKLWFLFLKIFRINTDFRKAV